MRKKKKPERKGKDNTSKPPEKQFGQKITDEHGLAIEMLRLKEAIEKLEPSSELDELEAALQRTKMRLKELLAKKLGKDVEDVTEKDIEEALRSPLVNWDTHKVIHDPKTGKPKYKGQKIDYGISEDDENLN